MSYATGFPEKISYSIAKNIEGPYKYKGVLNEIDGNSNTNHQAIVELKGQCYFIYQNGGSSYSRSVCIAQLEISARRENEKSANDNGRYSFILK